MTLACPRLTKLAISVIASHARMTAEVTNQKVTREDAGVLTERIPYLLFVHYSFSLPSFLLLLCSE